MAVAVESALFRLLESAGCAYARIDHRPVRTAAEAAAVRGSPLETGAKSILFKTDDAFRLFVLQAARRISSRAIRRQLGVRRTRFATASELRRLTGLEPGAVPPFGRPVLPFDLLADRALAELPEIVFTAGSRSISIRMRTADYLALARPRLLDFSG